MLQTGIIFVFAFAYMAVLFAIAYFGDRRAEAGRSIISNPYIYSLSLAVYCTAWTFYGSVGRAAYSGAGFLPIYLGPTLTFILGLIVVKKIIRICKIHRITSIADFIASRYGKNATLGGVVTIIAVLGVIPYIALQLKAISYTFLLINQYPDIYLPTVLTEIPFYQDTAFYVTLLLVIFSILFGTRHIDAAERHEGLVAAIAFESIVKLGAFLSVGIYVTFFLFDGISDLFDLASIYVEIQRIFTLPPHSSMFAGWLMYIFLAMLAVILLPRQFQIIVVENVDESHLTKAAWLFPLYLLIINIFVLPVAFGGWYVFAGMAVDADTYVLTLPMAGRHPGLTLFVFIGGLSAATGMVIVETIALATMICNDLVMPTLLRLPQLGLVHRENISNLLLFIRRWSIVFVLLLAYIYFHFIADFYALVSIGLISFVAVAQFAPAVFGGMYWKRGTRIGTLWGLTIGFALWLYTLIIPSLSEIGLFSQSFVTDGPFGISLLKPYLLFGLKIELYKTDHIAHAVFWTLSGNLIGYIVGSLLSEPKTIEHAQSILFVDVFNYSRQPGGGSFWQRTALIPDLRSLMVRFLGPEHAEKAFANYGDMYQFDWRANQKADTNAIRYAETMLSGVIGSASARVMMASVVKEEPITVDEVMKLLDVTRQAIAHGKELEKMTQELRAANEKLKELDRLKDEFVSTVTHELRTPLTAVRSISEILQTTPDMSPKRIESFANIITKESGRLTRLINQVLDIQKIESGQLKWRMSSIDLIRVIQEAVSATEELIRKKHIQLDLKLPDNCPTVMGDHDRLMQVLVNLISNAVKFVNTDTGRIGVTLSTINAEDKDRLQIDVHDNGIGISESDQNIIFDEFQQIARSGDGRPAGSGLGLAIARKIIRHHGGRIWVTSRPGQGSTFSFTLPGTEVR